MRLGPRGRPPGTGPGLEEATPSAGSSPPTGVIAWFVRNRVAANLLFLGISLGGLLTVGEIPQEMIPDTESSAVSIRTVFPGAAAEVVEDGVLLSLEEALRDVSGVKEIAGMATDGVGLVTVAMDSSGDFRTFSDEIRERVESLTTLPEDAEDPVVSEIAVERLLLRISIYGDADERTLTEAAHLAREALSRVPGVGKVQIASGRDYEISIEVSEDVLTRFGLTFDQVAGAIRHGSADIAGGALHTRAGDVRLRTEAEAVAAQDFSRIPLIAPPDGGLVMLGDVATVTDGFADEERAARMNGQPAVFLEVLLAPGARMLETARAVHARIPALAAALPEGLSVTPWFDGWELFESRMEVLVRNGLQGLALIFLVLFFTMSTRLAVWTAAGLPVSFFGAFLLMPGLGVTISMISLFGFILTLGIVVDDAIVVGENVQRRMTERKLGPIQAAVRGTQQVLLPATFGVLTTIAAFAPLLGLPGVWGEIMGALPRIVIPVLAFSLLDATWILPHHMAHGGVAIRPSQRLARVRAGFQSGLDWAMDTLYRPALGWSLRNRLAAVALAILAVAPAMGLLAGGWVPVEPTPPFDADVVTMQVSLPPGSPVEETGEVVAALEEEIARIREDQRNVNGVDPQRHLAVLVGQRLPFGPGGAIGGEAGGSGATIGQVTLELLPAEQQEGFSTAEIADRLRAAGRQLPHGAEVTVVSSVLGQVADISIRISGTDLVELGEGAAFLQALLHGYAGVIAVWDDLQGSAPELVARVRSGGAGVGIGAGEFGRQLRQAFHGEEVQRIQRGRDEVRVLLRYPRSEREDLDAITGMRVRRADGGVTPLSAVAEVSSEDGLSVIQRVDERRAITVQASVDPALTSAGAMLADLRNRGLSDFRQHFPGLRFEVVGLAGDQEETFAALQQNLMLALMLIYALLAIPLSSWIQPFVIMTAVPFGLAGAVFGHLIMGIELSMVSFFGVVPLVGIVVNDALVLLDFINQRRRAGASMLDAALAAGPLRFRPVILTTVTTCAGLAPLMIERSAQAQVLVPMAVSLAFGVAFATLVTLLLVPVLYTLADDALAFARGSG